MKILRYIGLLLVLVGLSGCTIRAMSGPEPYPVYYHQPAPFYYHPGHGHW